MNYKNRGERGKKSSGTAVIPAILAIVLAMNAAAGTADGSLIILLVAICFIAGIGAAIVMAAKKAARSGALKFNSAGKREKNTVEDKALSSTGSRAPAVYNERAAEELFLRDRQKRLEQLEVFLKNGIVDKNEYNLLKKRYENYSYERN